VAFASQSGAFGIAAIDETAARGIGLSSFVVMGDKADLSGNDFLEYWEQDPDTSVLLVMSSRLAARAGSGGSRAGSPRASRSWRSRAAGPRPAVALCPPKPAPCSRPPT
jgi:hypothetical protein